MKRFFALFLALITVFALFAGCGKQDADDSQPPGTSQQDNTPDTDKNTPAGKQDTSAVATPSNVQKPADDTPVRTSTSDIQKLPASTDVIKP